MKNIIGAIIYALVVVPFSIALAWFGIWWSIAFIAVTLFLYFKLMNWLEEL